MKKRLRDCTVEDLRKYCYMRPHCGECALHDCLCGGFDGLNMEIDIPDIELPHIESPEEEQQ